MKLQYCLELDTYRDSLRFQVLFMDVRFYRLHILLSNRVTIESRACPQISNENIYLWGSSIEESTRPIIDDPYMPLEIIHESLSLWVKEVDWEELNGNFGYKSRLDLNTRRTRYHSPIGKVWTV